MPTPNFSHDTFNFADPEDNAPTEAWELQPVFIKSYSTGGGSGGEEGEPPIDGVRIYVDNADSPPETSGFDFIA